MSRPVSVAKIVLCAMHMSCKNTFQYDPINFLISSLSVICMMYTVDMKAFSGTVVNSSVRPYFQSAFVFFKYSFKTCFIATK